MVTYYKTAKNEEGYKMDEKFDQKTLGISNKSWFVVPNNDQKNKNSPFYIMQRYFRCIVFCIIRQVHESS